MPTMRGVAMPYVRRFVPALRRLVPRRRGGLAVAAVLAIVVLAYTGIAHRQARAWGGNWSGFICIGDRFIQPEQTPPGTLVLRRSHGYDGQFFYLMAQDPWLRGDRHTLIDVPAYRYQRIMYAWLAWAASWGRVTRLPEAMIAVNGLAILAGTLFAALMARQEGRSAWAALGYACLSGLLLGFLRTLAEPVAMAGFMAALWAYRRDRLIGFALAMSFTLLARETMVLMIPVLWFDRAVLKRQWLRALWILAPLLPWLAWQAYVMLRLGQTTWGGGARNVGRPMVALLAHGRQVLPSPDRPLSEKVYLVGFVAASALTVAAALWDLIRRHDGPALGFLGFALLPFVMTQHVWVEPWSYGRVLVPAAVLLVFAFLRSGTRWYAVPMALHLALFFVALDWNRLLFYGRSAIDGG